MLCYTIQLSFSIDFESLVMKVFFEQKKKIYAQWKGEPLSQIHAYIGHYKPSTYSTTAVVCVNFIFCYVGSQGWGCMNLITRVNIVRLVSTANNRFLRNFFMAGLFTLRVFGRNLEEIA